MNRLTMTMLAGVMPMFVGCASIVGGTQQPLTVETQSRDGQAVAGAACRLSNNKGAWKVTTPGSVTVHRSFEPLEVQCEHEHHEPGSARVASKTKAMAFGNALVGGPVGAGVDMATGAAYDYPPVIGVTLGRREAGRAP